MEATGQWIWEDHKQNWNKFHHLKHNLIRSRNMQRRPDRQELLNSQNLFLHIYKYQPLHLNRPEQEHRFLIESDGYNNNKINPKPEMSSFFILLHIIQSKLSMQESFRLFAFLPMGNSQEIVNFAYEECEQ